jgi:hypothetical protein
MVAFAHLLTLLSVLVAMSRADEVAQAKTEEVDEKWYYGGFRTGYWGLSGMSLYSSYPSLYTNYYSLLNSNCYGVGIFPYRYNLLNGYFAKATDAEKSVSRRAISLDAEQLVRRDTADSFTCATHGAAPQTFSAKECVGYVLIPLNISHSIIPLTARHFASSPGLPSNCPRRRSQ